MKALLPMLLAGAVVTAMWPPTAPPTEAEAIAAWKANLDAERAAAALLPPGTNKVYHTVQFGGAFAQPQWFIILQGSTNLIDWVDLARFPATNCQLSFGDTNHFSRRFYRQVWGCQQFAELTLSNTP